MTICTPNPKDRVLFGLDRSADATVLKVCGEVDLETGRASDHALQRATKRRPPRLAVSLVRCAYLDPTALTILIAAHLQLQGRLAIVAFKDARVRSVFEMLRLDELLSVVPTLVDAPAPPFPKRRSAAASLTAFLSTLMDRMLSLEALR